MTQPRPVPQFYNQSLLTKKTRYSTPYNRKIQPPRPCKSISPKSSFHNRFLNGSSNASFKAQAVSFKENSINQSILSKHYDENCDELYFQQCFEVFSTLGSGFFGDVYKVKSKEDGKFYAIKKSRERFKGSSDRNQKLQEVAKHEHLPEHPNLVKFYKAWEEKQRLYIQIELCECSLSMFADLNHDIPENVVWDFLIDMLQALEHLHLNRLLHLDFKPENIFISKEGLYKLGDFGLVVDLSKKSSIEPLEGDPKYLAKETIQGIFTEAADIFSLGITTLELATDLDLPSREEAWHLLRNGNIPDYCFKNMSPDLKYIIKRMMHPDYSKRPSATELLNLPIIKKLRRKRIIKNKIRIFYHNSIEKLTQFFIFLMSFLLIYKLIDFIKSLFIKTETDSITPEFKKDSSQLSFLQNSFSCQNNLFGSTYKNKLKEDDPPINILDTSMNFGKDLKNRNYNYFNMLQDSTVNSSANPNYSINNVNLQDITPPNSSFNHYIKDQADLQSTTHRGVKNKTFSNTANLSFSASCETPVKKEHYSIKPDDSPTSIYFANSFNQSNRLDFSDISDEDDDMLHNSSKFNLSLHNQTVGQKNLLKVFESIDED